MALCLQYLVHVCVQGTQTENPYHNCFYVMETGLCEGKTHTGCHTQIVLKRLKIIAGLYFFVL
jgi:hypothetical protein